MTLYVVRFADGNVQASTPAGALALLRRGGARLVAGDRAALLALDTAELERLRDALRPDDEQQADLGLSLAPAGLQEAPGGPTR